jgi:hypothetical protein
MRVRRGHSTIALLAIALVTASAQEQRADGAVSAEDLRVIDAALSHKARTAPGLGKTRLHDQTLAACAEGRSSSSCIPVDPTRLPYSRRAMPELTEERLAALAARNPRPHRLTSSPASDVVLISREELAAMRPTRLRRDVHAFTSLPVYFDDDTALIYLGFSCGGLCGEGNFILLRRGANGWRVHKAAMTWIS